MLQQSDVSWKSMSEPGQGKPMGKGKNVQRAKELNSTLTMQQTCWVIGKLICHSVRKTLKERKTQFIFAFCHWPQKKGCPRHVFVLVDNRKWEGMCKFCRLCKMCTCCNRNQKLQIIGKLFWRKRQIDFNQRGPQQITITCLAPLGALCSLFYTYLWHPELH